MNRDFVVLPEAANDLRKAYWWYEEQNLGLGEEFMRTVLACFHSIQKNPEIYRLVFGSYRRALVRRFPYAVFYEFTEEKMYIYSVFHCSQDPSKWKARLKM
jgi:plasmid stabilization system protein ParE